MNSITYSGYVGREPSRRFVNGKQVVSTSLSQIKRDKSTQWLNVEGWEKYGKSIEKFSKGDSIIVCGELELNEKDSKIFVTIILSKPAELISRKADREKLRNINQYFVQSNEAPQEVVKEGIISTVNEKNPSGYFSDTKFEIDFEDIPKF